VRYLFEASWKLPGASGTSLKVPGSSRKLLGPSRKFPDLLEAPGSFRELPGPLGSFPDRTSWNSRELPGTAVINTHPEAPGSFPTLLEAPWSFPEAPGSFPDLLGASVKLPEALGSFPELRWI